MSFERMKVAGPVFLTHAVFDRPVDFYAMEVDGNFVADNSTFKDDAVFELMKVAGRVVFSGAVFNGPTTFYSAKVAESLFADGAQFNDTRSGANFEGLSADAALFWRATFKGPVRFYGLNISTNFEANYAVFDESKDSANFQSMVIKGHLLLRNVVCNRPVSFYGTTVGNGFWIDFAQFNDNRSGVFLNEMKTDNVEVRGTVFKGPVVLSGTTYREVSQDSLEDFRKILRQSNYDTGAYAELEEYYRRHGIIDQADDVYVERRRRERSNLWWPQRWLDALVLDLGVGYGRHIWRLIIPSLILIGIGCCVFRSRELMDPQKPEYESRHFSRFLYSLSLFLPIVDLQSASVWMPKQDRPAVRRYLPVHVIASWILVTILVGALTGILK